MSLNTIDFSGPVKVSSPKSSLSSASGPIACREHESIYERIWRKGYGPPGGDKMDEADWRKYLDDEMFPLEYHKMILDVFADVLPEQWKPQQVRVEWLDGVDKNLTSRSEAFARYPQFQIMWQKGYGPPDGDKLDVEAWDDYMDGMPSDKRHNMMQDLFLLPPDSHHYDKLWEIYLNQTNETEGFDIDVYPPDGCGVIRPLFDDMSLAKTDHSLINCSRIALDAYNHREGTDYTLYQVVKACAQLVAGQIYFITFEAINSSDHLQVFQAKVFEPIPIKGPNEVLLVRPKA
ncbi:hypothetical protein LIER_41310 [Lithospermum erythrorhizon]|uniref:Cystatin domain-containing protein n=1 Tax=Lithospermum erythrorhizon TaxID=34254 RepID=A0AAV3R3N1_LITER